jgi:hypothetical protein
LESIEYPVIEYPIIMSGGEYPISICNEYVVCRMSYVVCDCMYVCRMSYGSNPPYLPTCVDVCVELRLGDAVQPRVVVPLRGI